MQVSGILKAGEASATAAAVGARLRGSQIYLWIVMAVLMAVGAVLAFGVGFLLHVKEPLDYAPLGFLVGAWSYVYIARRIVIHLFRRRLVARGLSSDLPMSVELSPDGVIYEIGDIRQTAKWRAVTDLFKSRDYWIFLAQGSAMFAPMRFFKSTDEERAFIATALDRMPPEARARSDQAVQFVKAAKPG